MEWCLDCHREPEKHLRPTSEVTTMGYVEKQHAAHVKTLADKGGDFTIDDMRKKLADVGQQLKKEKGINPPQYCSGCHR